MRGRRRPRGTLSYHVTYRGVRLRSLLELSVVRHLEDCGLVLGTDMTYESTTVPYGKTRKRNYIVDLTIPCLKTLVEVKPSVRADNRNNLSKREGAEAWCRANGWSYVIITEVELRAAGGRTISLEEAGSIADVVLEERAARALRRKVATKARRKIRRKR